MWVFFVSYSVCVFGSSKTLIGPRYILLSWFVIVVLTAPSFSIAVRAMPANRAGFSFTMRLITNKARNGSNFTNVRSKFMSGYLLLKSVVPCMLA